MTIFSLVTSPHMLYLSEWGFTCFVSHKGPSNSHIQ